MDYNTKGTRAHTHRELIREWLWEPKGSSLEYIAHTNTRQEQHNTRPHEEPPPRRLIRAILISPRPLHLSAPLRPSLQVTAGAGGKGSAKSSAGLLCSHSHGDCCVHIHTENLSPCRSPPVPAPRAAPGAVPRVGVIRGSNHTTDQSPTPKTLCGLTRAGGLGCALVWPLHDIAITNVLWCMAYTRGVGGRAYIAQSSWNSTAIG